jgi:hypothetical protein
MLADIQHTLPVWRDYALKNIVSSETMHDVQS